MDKQTHQPTLSRTESRYQLQGTDLGYSFDHQGKIYFLFGDTVGARDAALDSMATADIGGEAMDPERGARLDFLMQSPSLYLTVQPPRISMGAFDVPTAGISRRFTRLRPQHHPSVVRLRPPAFFPWTDGLRRAR